MPENPTPSPARPTPPPSVAFVRFVSCVKDKPVTRFQLGARAAPRAGNFFGARREGGALVYDEEAVFGITAEEWSSFGREYTRAINDRHLRERDRKEYDAYRAAQADRAKQAAAQAERDAAEAQAKADAEATKTQGEETKNGPSDNTPAGGEPK